MRMSEAVTKRVLDHILDEMDGGVATVMFMDVVPTGDVDTPPAGSAETLEMTYPTNPYNASTYAGGTATAALKTTPVMSGTFIKASTIRSARIRLDGVDIFECTVGWDGDGQSPRPDFEFAQESDLTGLVGQARTLPSAPVTLDNVKS